MLDVNHFLGIYKVRQSMQREGITKPKPEIIEFTNKIVNILSYRPLDEKLDLIKNDQSILELINDKNELIILFPNFKEIL